MFAIIWNLLRFHVTDRLLTGIRINSECLTTNALARLEENTFPEGRTADAQRFIVHMDNSSIHTSGVAED
jgi:hypothetical protein